jgi:hypothetical protein
MAARCANDFNRDALEMQFCALRDGVLADHIPIKLDGVIDCGRPLSHDNEQVGDFFGFLRFGVADSDLEDALGDG